MCLVTLQPACCTAALQHPASPLATQAPSDKSVDGERGRRLVLDGPRVPQASALYAIICRLAPAGELRGAGKTLGAWRRHPGMPFLCHMCTYNSAWPHVSSSHFVCCGCFDTCPLTRVANLTRVCVCVTAEQQGTTTDRAAKCWHYVSPAVSWHHLPTPQRHSTLPSPIGLHAFAGGSPPITVLCTARTLRPCCRCI